MGDPALGRCEVATLVPALDVMHSYFSYSIMTMCGIPTITLLGTPEDWDAVRERAAVLVEFGPEGWGQSLLAVLDQFAAARRGSVDRPFWRSMYKYMDMSGGDLVTGWINALFPYIEASDGPRQNGASVWDPRTIRGAPVSCLPTGMSLAEFKWKQGGAWVRWLSRSAPMAFTSRFVGVSQDPETLTVRPAIGWAVRRR